MQISVKEAAVKAGKSEQTVRRWIKSGKIKGCKEDGLWKVSEESINAGLTCQVKQVNSSNHQAQQQIAISEDLVDKIADKVVNKVLKCLEPILETIEKKQESQQNKYGLERIDALEKEVTSLSIELKILHTNLDRTLSQIKTLEYRLENQGEEIHFNGRAQSPRAYLHSVENSNKYGTWKNIKAKVALEIGEQEAVVLCHYSHSAEVGG